MGMKYYLPLWGIYLTVHPLKVRIVSWLKLKETTTVVMIVVVTMAEGGVEAEKELGFNPYIGW